VRGSSIYGDEPSGSVATEVFCSFRNAITFVKTVNIALNFYDLNLINM
jgi:hypothetical protein